MDTFRLATIEIDGQACAALHVSDAYWPLARNVSVMDLLEEWDNSFAQLALQARDCAEGALSRDVAIPASRARLLSPLRFPRKIIGVAFNYGGQFRELGLPPKPWQPRGFFTRPATTTLIGPSEAMHMPLGNGLDWELEIGAVMGRRMRNVSAEEGLRGVAGYVVTIDFTVRDLLPVSTPFATDLFRAKCQDGLSPIGAWLTPAAFVPNPHDLRLQLAINGETKQDARSSDMLVRIGDLISEASRYLTWEPGDLLLTGTPAGVGHGMRPPTYLHAGEVLRTTIEGIGELRNRCVAEPG
jgi:2-keto-4-pentenoate hydratase/2-oxohepta-3-ene-1,7-dioic acid hydratase in catechol pathway